MTLAAGTRLGPYEITSPIGAGDMGEVYNFRDTRLDFTVAITILPPASPVEGKNRFAFPGGHSVPRTEQIKESRQ